MQSCTHSSANLWLVASQKSESWKTIPNIDSGLGSGSSNILGLGPYAMRGPKLKKTRSLAIVFRLCAIGLLGNIPAMNIYFQAFALDENTGGHTMFTNKLWPLHRLFTWRLFHVNRGIRNPPIPENDVQNGMKKVFLDWNPRCGS